MAVTFFQPEDKTKATRNYSVNAVLVGRKEGSIEQLNALANALDTVHASYQNAATAKKNSSYTPR